MIQEPVDILRLHPIRKSKKQKQAFREEVKAYCESLGYTVTVENGSMGAKNVVIGDPKQAKYLVTAHYDTPARMFLPNFITPCNFPVYLLYQLLIVGLFFLLAFFVAFVITLLTDDIALALWGAYVGYFGMLFLLMFGPANKNNYNDNSSGLVTVLEILRSLPESQRHKACFVLFDLEEAGLIGSASYRKAHKSEAKDQIVLNLDCVGDGNEIMMFPTGKLKKNSVKMDEIGKICGEFGQKSIILHRKGFAICPSDQSNFPYGVGIMAFRRKKGLGLYCDRIHTKRDTVLEHENVNILRAALTTLICQ